MAHFVVTFALAFQKRPAQLEQFIWENFIPANRATPLPSSEIPANRAPRFPDAFR